MLGCACCDGVVSCEAALRPIAARVTTARIAARIQPCFIPLLMETSVKKSESHYVASFMVARDVGSCQAALPPKSTACIAIATSRNDLELSIRITCHVCFDSQKNDSMLGYSTSAAIGQRIKAEIRQELRLVASVGVAPVKFVAKIASDLEKPDGFVVVDADGVQEFLDPLPVSRLWGVGRVT